MPLSNEHFDQLKAQKDRILANREKRPREIADRLEGCQPAKNGDKGAAVPADLLQEAIDCLRGD